LRAALRPADFFAVAFFAVDLLPATFLAVDFLAVDFVAALRAVDFFPVERPAVFLPPDVDFLAVAFFVADFLVADFLAGDAALPATFLVADAAFFPAVDFFVPLLLAVAFFVPVAFLPVAAMVSLFCARLWARSSQRCCAIAGLDAAQVHGNFDIRVEQSLDNHPRRPPRRSRNGARRPLLRCTDRSLCHHDSQRPAPDGSDASQSRHYSTRWHAGNDP